MTTNKLTLMICIGIFQIVNEVFGPFDFEMGMGR